MDELFKSNAYNELSCCEKFLTEYHCGETRACLPHHARARADATLLSTHLADSPAGFCSELDRGLVGGKDSGAFRERSLAQICVRKAPFPAACRAPWPRRVVEQNSQPLGVAHSSFIHGPL
jgi:hypothetical protein